MKSVMTAEIIGHIREFIRARHLGDMDESTEHQAWLKRKLKKNFTRVLLRNGDPDRDNGYLKVMNLWFEQERDAVQREGA